MSTDPTFAPDAAIVLGLASTAMPFARSADAQAERWLRMLRQHGEAGVALQALGVSEESLAHEDDRDAALARDDVAGHVGAGLAPGGDPVARVSDAAAQISARRGAAWVSTVDVLMAVMHVYAGSFDRVLEAHGTDRDTVLVLLGAQVREPAAT